MTTNINVPDDIIHIMSLWPKFALPPYKKFVIETITSIESAIKNNSLSIDNKENTCDHSDICSKPNFALYKLRNKHPSNEMGIFYNNLIRDVKKTKNKSR